MPRKYKIFIRNPKIANYFSKNQYVKKYVTFVFFTLMIVFFLQ